MTKAHLLAQYKNFKKQLENVNQKQVWKNNIQHGIDSILVRYPEFADISKEEEPKPTTTSSKKKGK